MTTASMSADEVPTLERELTQLLNRRCQENASNTPDFVLAQYLLGCLAAFNTAVQQRETWYGRDARPGSLGGLVDPHVDLGGES